MGAHYANEPSTCCHVHAEDLPANEEPKQSDMVQQEWNGPRRADEGWTAQRALPRRVLTEGVSGEIITCVTCGMALSSRDNEEHNCPALQNSHQMQEHIPPAPYRPRQPD